MSLTRTIHEHVNEHVQRLDWLICETRALEWSVQVARGDAFPSNSPFFHETFSSQARQYLNIGLLQSAWESEQSDHHRKIGR